MILRIWEWLLDHPVGRFIVVGFCTFIILRSLILLTDWFCAKPWQTWCVP